MSVYDLEKRKLMKRAKRQGLWPIPMKYQGMHVEPMLRAMADDTGHKVAYIRAIYELGLLIRPADRPVQIISTLDDPSRYVGRGKYRNKPNPKVRRGVLKSREARESIITQPDRAPIEHTTIRTNAGQLARVARDHAPVIMNGKMNKESRYNTMYSTGFNPPSRVVKATFESPQQIKERKGKKRFSAT